MNARPFFKSAGGKTSLLSTILKYATECRSEGTYYEPFVGGGAVFYQLANESRFDRAYLNDTNTHLMSAYGAVRDDVDGLIRKLRWYAKKHLEGGKDFYLKIRSQHDKDSEIEKAARFIYLNKTCFNGLWRVNKKGQFNVPFGDYKNPKICDEKNLRACSEVLQRVRLTSVDFEKLMFRVKKGDFVFCDPPYHPRVGKEFTGYHQDGFGLEDQTRLRDAMLELKKRGANVMITNSGADEIRTLYSKGFRIIETQGRRSVGATAVRRGYVPDLLIV